MQPRRQIIWELYIYDKCNQSRKTTVLTFNGIKDICCGQLTEAEAISPVVIQLVPDVSAVL